MRRENEWKSQWKRLDCLQTFQEREVTDDDLLQNTGSKGKTKQPFATTKKKGLLTP